MFYILCRDGLVHIWKNQQLHSVCAVWSYSEMKGLKVVCFMCNWSPISNFKY